MITNTNRPQFENWVREPKFIATMFRGRDICKATKGADEFLVLCRDHLGRCFGNITQICIAKIQRNMLMKPNYKEPTYSEKVLIKEAYVGGGADKVAMEIFPRPANVVDRADVYHIWLAEKAKFPFGISEATEVPQDKEWESETIGGMDIEYKVRTIRTTMGKVAYFYIRRTDGKELRWVEKQQIKNNLQSEELTAIELISEQGIDKPTCLICLPLGYFLDFGLHID